MDWKAYLDLIDLDEVKEEDADVMGAVTVLNNTSPGKLTLLAEDFLSSQDKGVIAKCERAYHFAELREMMVQEGSAPKISAELRANYRNIAQSISETIKVVLS